MYGEVQCDMGPKSTIMGISLYTLYSAHMSPQTTHKLMGFYMKVLILGVILQYMVSDSLSCFL